MIIRMRYETEFEKFEMDVDAASKWVNISIEEDETQEHFEKGFRKRLMNSTTNLNTTFGIEKQDTLIQHLKEKEWTVEKAIFVAKRVMTLLIS